MDLTSSKIRTILWATGFRPDHSWLDLPIFDRKGRFLLAFGGSGRGDGLLWLPTGIFLDGEDRIYVADSGNSRIQVYQYVRQGD